ncbi:MAG: SGNH/GDSL hydrolase family protein [Mucilaginibacter sp.]|uniref:SGNH/GDSL hydrolase family protein n=1 Tax=Mucilaginibacter sp. TaxID=1882438 RepID=UPI003267B620
MKKKFLITLLILQLNLAAYAQTLSSPLFKDGDIVCWIGDSITNNGQFYNYVYLYYATRFPNDRLWFYNCGISGDVSGGVLKRMDSDVLIHKPNWSVLMIGMNDVKRNLYTIAAKADPDLPQKWAQAMAKYKEDSEAIVKILAAKSKVILQKPSIFDQTAAIKAENAIGVNEALKFGGDHMQDLSMIYKTKLVDYWSIMKQVNRSVQKVDSTATIIGPDRIHPGPAGHFVMAYQFLKETGAPKFVSKIVVDKGVKTSRGKSINCKIESQKVDNRSVEFTCLEYSLPFPVWDDAVKALSWVPFTDELNKEILQVVDLSAGYYKLSIDSILVGKYTAAQLKEGINLATEKQTPQYQQAIRVMDLCLLYRKTEGLLRSLKFVEYNHLGELKNLNDTTEIRQLLAVNLEKLKNSGHYDYYKSQFNGYLTNKPKQPATESKLLSIQTQIYTTNKPTKHVFKLIKDD